MTENQNDGPAPAGQRERLNDPAFLGAASSAISTVYLATRSVPAVVATAAVAAVLAVRRRSGR